jgi:hypothetical protein
MAGSKDPIFAFASRGFEGSFYHQHFVRKFHQGTPGRAVTRFRETRGPSTSQDRSQSERFCCARDDSLENGATIQASVWEDSQGESSTLLIGVDRFSAGMKSLPSAGRRGALDAELFGRPDAALKRRSSTCLLFAIAAVTVYDRAQSCQANPFTRENSETLAVTSVSCWRTA